MPTRKRVTVRKTGIAEAERRIAKCKRSKATMLDLGYLRLRRLPESLRALTELRNLNLTRNELTVLPGWLGELSELRQLSVQLNPLRAMEPSIGDLAQLEALIIGNGSASAANSAIGSLRNLRLLVIHSYKLKEVPAWIRRLTRLKQLVVSDNQITELPQWLGDLSQLEYLDVSFNRLRSLPESIRHISGLKGLDVTGNRGLALPSEIAASSDSRKILDYYFRTLTTADRQPLNEFKLILVGRGGVGKTTLVHRLVTGKYKEFKRTPGIKITKWPVQIDGDEVRAHIWDFGGQEIMHGTHRFFMTERALYLVLISGREGTEDHDAEYWLSLVRSFAGDVPVIILLNKWDDYPFELNRELLREKYGRRLVFVETDSSEDIGIAQLRVKIQLLAKKLPGLKVAWPAEWRRIKEVLPGKKKSWLTFRDFCGVCSEEGIKKLRDQEALAESLHDLGLMLSYRREEALRDFGVLNPLWVTKGIYQMLNAPSLREAGGRFTLEDFGSILATGTYPKVLHPFLLALMRKFHLCHPLDEKGTKYLIPELLTKEEPKLESEFPPQKCLGFIYQYDAVLPEGLLPRFIVETYVHREPKYVWRTGVVLERANSRALVRGDVQGRTVTVRVAGVGNGRRELLGIVREHFERIHKSYEKLPVTELVPVPKHPEVTVPYADLLDYEAAGDDEYKVVISRQPVRLSVQRLLDGVDLPGVLRGRMALERSPLKVRSFLAEPLSLFISYSHKDEPFRDQLRGALTAYERKGELEAWDDTCILPGQKWEPEILDKLERGDIIVLLLSNDFIRSDYCMQKEMKQALERDAANECALVPIVVRACAFAKIELGQLQAIQPKGKPIKNHRDRDTAWLEVTRQLDRVIANLKNRAVRHRHARRLR